MLALRDALLAPAVASSQIQQAAADVAAIAAATHTAIAEAAAKAEEAAAKAAPSCQICFEPYGDAVVPRMLVACGHTFCEGCLNTMLRCAPPTS